MSDSYKVYTSKDYVKNKIEESRVQPDWNQNDETKPDYVKNRTHYDAKEYSFPYKSKCLTPQVKTEIVDKIGSSSVQTYKHLSRMSLVTPTQEEIMLNGMLGGRTSETALTAEQIVQGVGDGYVIFDANLSQIQAAVAFSATTLRIPRSLGGEHVLEITEPGLYLLYSTFANVSLSWGGVRPLDDKYIPSTIARKTDLESAGGSGGGVQTVNGVAPDESGNVDTTKVTCGDYILQTGEPKYAGYGFAIKKGDDVRAILYNDGLNIGDINATGGTTGGVTLTHSAFKIGDADKRVEISAPVGSTGTNSSLTLKNSSSEKLVIEADGYINASGKIIKFGSSATFASILRYVKSPEQTTDAANKAYVDAKISDTAVILNSSTEGSTKKFKITVDDSGTLTATEI